MSALFAKTEAEIGTLNIIQSGIEAVERQLKQAICSDVEVVQKVGSHTLAAGGKRLRPAFMRLAAQSVGTDFDSDRADRLGACLEMIHMATLIHDDVIDHAVTRRGRSTAASIFGNAASILTGDVLLAKAMAILADDGDLRIIRAVSKAVVEMAEGEAKELSNRGNYDLPESEHLAVLRMKTAAFVECCCRVGALLANASDEIVAGLARYGHHIGMAFQIVDDVLDYRGNEEATGKPRATDFNEGCATLPLMYLRPLLNDEETQLMRKLFGTHASHSDIKMIVTWMDVRGVFAKAEKVACSHSDAANLALAVLPSSGQSRFLMAVSDFVINRAM